MLITGLPPIVGQNPKVLILGSMPGERSLKLQQYYANPQNSFWFIMGEICGAKPELHYPERTTQLTKAGIALWDVLKHCEREGSLDNHILKHTEVPNDFNEFLQHYPRVEIICFNGQKAARYFEKLVMPMLVTDLREKIKLITLPSTSPANTTISRTEKFKAWKEAIKPYIVTATQIVSNAS
jgi:hypoxanthine-DNA glycosylase